MNLYEDLEIKRNSCLDCKLFKDKDYILIKKTHKEGGFCCKEGEKPEFMNKEDLNYGFCDELQEKE